MSNEIKVKSIETQTQSDDLDRHEKDKNDIHELQAKFDILERKINEMIKQLSNSNLGNRTVETKEFQSDSSNEIKTIGLSSTIEEITAELSSSLNDEQKGEIKLMPKNIVEGVLSNGEILTFVLDSGSSLTLISEAIVLQSPVLSRLQTIQIQQICMHVGNDSIIRSDKKISIPLTIQNYDFQITFLIVPGLTKRISIIGDDVLRSIGSVMFLKQKVLQFDISPICLKVKHDYVLKPMSEYIIKIVKGQNVNCPFSYQLPLKTYDKFFRGKIYSHQDGLHIKNESQYELIINKGEILAMTVNNYVDLNFCNNIENYVDYSEKFSNNTIIDQQHMPILDSSKDNENIIFKFKDEDLPIIQDTSETTDNPVIKDSSATQLKLTPEQKQFISTLNEQQKATYMDRINKYKWLNFDDNRLYKSVSEIIDDKLHLENTILNKPEQDQLRGLIQKHCDAMSNFGEIGSFKTKASIQFKKHDSFSMRPYPVPVKFRQALLQEVARLKSLGILEDAQDNIDFSSGFAVLKSNLKSVRLVVDLRRLNFVTEKDSYKMLNFQLLLKYMSDESPKVISILDIDSAYHSLKCCEETKRYLGVTIGEHNYQLNSIPQGAKNSAAQFTRHLDKVLSKHKHFKINLFSYIDDLILFNNDIQSHFSDLEELFQIFKNEGLKLSLDKCSFAITECTILGHVFTCNPDGISLKAAKKRVDAIDKIAIPRNLKELRSFLGACNYLSRYVENYRRIASELYKLTGRKNCKFTFEDKHIKSFFRIKELIKSSKIIHLPNPNAKKRLTTDSSITGFGSILVDVLYNPDGSEKLHVLGYESRTYNAKTFGSSMHFEMYAVVCSILAFKYYLYGIEFEVHTDSKALAQFAQGRTQLQETPVLLRLWEKISSYSFTIVHVKANSNGLIKVADAFSRLDLKTNKEHVEYNPHIVQPIAYPSKFLEYIPDEHSEQVLNTSQNDCYYNLRKDIKKPERYGIEEYDDDDDDESEEDEIEGEAIKKEKHKEESELEKLAKQFQNVPEYMINPARSLFENVNANKVSIKFYPKQLHLNKFLNDILECCNDFGESIISHKELQSEQRISPVYRDLYRYLYLDVLPASRNLIRQVITLSEEICLLDNILCHVRTNKLTNKLQIRPVIPSSQLALRLIHHLHSSKTANHLAITSTYKILNSKYYIKNLIHLIKIYVKGCVSCNFNKKINPEGSGYDFHLCLSPKNNLDAVYIDIKSMYTDENGFNYLLVVTDAKSKFIMGEALKTRSTKEIINALLKLFCIFGAPKKIYSDLEGGVTSLITKAFLDFLNIEISFCLSMAHSTHGIVERAIYRITQRLCHLLAQKEKYWVSLSQLAILSANSVIRTAGYSSFYLMYGREPHMNKPIKDLDLNFDLPKDDIEYLQNIKSRFEEADRICKDIDFSEKRAQIAKHRTNIKSIKDFQILDLVYTQGPRGSSYMNSNSLKIYFSNIGPLVIAQRLNDRTFKLRTLDNKEIMIDFHINRLEECFLLVGQKLVSNLTSLISEIKVQGVKNKEHILEKLKETEKFIIDANKLEITENITDVISEDKNEHIEINNCCIITQEPINEELGQIKRLKWYKGELFCLVNLPSEKLNRWEHIAFFPQNVREQIFCHNKLRVVGSLKRYRKMLDMK